MILLHVYSEDLSFRIIGTIYSYDNKCKQKIPNLRKNLKYILKKLFYM